MCLFLTEETREMFFYCKNRECTLIFGAINRP